MSNKNKNNNKPKVETLQALSVFDTGVEAVLKAVFPDGSSEGGPSAIFAKVNRFQGVVMNVRVSNLTAVTTEAIEFIRDKVKTLGARRFNPQVSNVPETAYLPTASEIKSYMQAATAAIAHIIAIKRWYDGKQVELKVTAVADVKMDDFLRRGTSYATANSIELHSSWKNISNSVWVEEIIAPLRGIMLPTGVMNSLNYLFGATHEYGENSDAANIIVFQPTSAHVIDAAAVTRDIASTRTQWLADVTAAKQFLIKYPLVAEILEGLKWTNVGTLNYTRDLNGHTLPVMADGPSIKLLLRNAHQLAFYFDSNVELSTEDQADYETLDFMVDTGKLATSAFARPSEIDAPRGVIESLLLFRPKTKVTSLADQIVDSYIAEIYPKQNGAIEVHSYSIPVAMDADQTYSAIDIAAQQRWFRVMGYSPMVVCSDDTTTRICDYDLDDGCIYVPNIHEAKRSLMNKMWLGAPKVVNATPNPL